MDKKKVVEAYRRGLLTMDECAQIIGANKGQLNRLLDIRSDSWVVVNMGEKCKKTNMLLQ